ncbi:unnamed protein product [Adineta ricciae]|uniref:Hexosyltransferase n=1 Tax=Adineta ricciae TaxID=249248 RepID=A0A813WKP7_ADIRI|nr:unnamed protein product [Adineta ricciae]
MFERYSSRRRRHRLKIFLLSIAAGCIFLLILSHYQNSPLSTESSSLIGSNEQLVVRRPLEKSRPRLRPESKLQPLPTIAHLSDKKSTDFLSTFTFTNSPFLNLSSELPVIIPIIILSKASDIEVRDAIRRTWGFDRLHRNATIQYKIFFLVGIDDLFVKRIHTEQILFDDVIQVSLPDCDSYFAYKELSAMLWMKTYLPHTPYYIKTEDDVIMNINAIIKQFLPSMESYLTKNLIIGWFDREHNIDRGTYQRFINAVIPPSSADLSYAMSSFYIVTSQAWNSMLNTMKNVENIQQPGDPFVTGILRKASHVEVKNLATSTEYFRYEVRSGACKDAFLRDPSLLFCTSPLLLSPSQSISLTTTLTKVDVTPRSVTEYFDVWNTLLSQNTIR